MAKSLITEIAKKVIINLRERFKIGKCTSEFTIWK